MARVSSRIQGYQIGAFKQCERNGFCVFSPLLMLQDTNLLLAAPRPR